MLFSFEILTRKLHQDVTFYLVDQDRVIPFVATKSRSRHIYNNVPVSGIPSVLFPGDSQLLIKSYSPESYLNREQQEANKNLKIHNNVSFQYTVKGNPSRAVISFPHTKGPGGWELPYGVLDAQKFSIEDALFISFQDPYLTSGSYFLADNFGNDPIPSVLEVIRDLLAQYGIPEAKSTLVGSSKGAASAAIVSRHLQGNQLVVVNYSTDLSYKLHATEWAHIGASLDYFNIEIPDTLAILLHEAESKQVHWFYSEKGDFSSNMDNEDIEAPYLKKWPSPEPHGKILQNRFEFITNLIDDYSGEDFVIKEGENLETFVFNSKQLPSLQLKAELLKRNLDKETISEIPFALDISACSRLDNLFEGYSSLRTSPPLKTGHIIRMDNMFAGCTSLVLVPELDTKNVSNMNYMFRDCSSLKAMPSMDTSHVRNMVGMFSGCRSLTEADKLETSSTWSLEHLFSGCEQLVRLPKLDLRRVSRLNFAFFGCVNLKEIQLVNADLIVQMKYAFGNCRNLKQLAELDLPRLAIADGIFYMCESLRNEHVRLQVSPEAISRLENQPGLTLGSGLVDFPFISSGCH